MFTMCYFMCLAALVRNKLYIYSIAAECRLLSGTTDSHQQPERDASKALFCYYSSTSQHRSNEARFTPEHIDVQLCTHVIFAFADIISGKYIRPHNWNDLRTGHDLGMFQQPNTFLLVCTLV